MPAYASLATVGGGQSIEPGQFVTVWSAETPTPGNGGAAASQAVPISQAEGTTGLAGISADGQFSGAPGAFEVDFQVSNVDVDTAYQTVNGGNVTAVDAVNFTFHIDAPYANCLFARLLMRSRTNAVSITARIKR